MTVVGTVTVWVCVVAWVIVVWTVWVRSTVLGVLLLSSLPVIRIAAITPATIRATAPKTHGHGLPPPEPCCPGGGAW